MRDFGIKQLGFYLIFLKVAGIMFTRIKEILCLNDILNPIDTLKKHINDKTNSDPEIILRNFNSYWNTHDKKPCLSNINL